MICLDTQQCVFILNALTDIDELTASPIPRKSEQSNRLLLPWQLDRKRNERHFQECTSKEELLSALREELFFVKQETSINDEIGLERPGTRDRHKRRDEARLSLARKEKLFMSQGTNAPIKAEERVMRRSRRVGDETGSKCEWPRQKDGERDEKSRHQVKLPAQDERSRR